MQLMQELSVEIEQVREKLHQLTEKHSLLSNEVIDLSIKLDKLIVIFQRLSLNHQDDDLLLKSKYLAS